MSVRNTIETEFLNILDESNEELLVEKLDDDVVLLESGLDSLGFAILVATLESTLGFDPFQEMQEAYYPVTYGEFVRLYEDFAEKKA